MICNCCGRKLAEKNTIVTEDYIEVTKKWGYFSKKDGITQHFVLCESCMDIIDDKFVIPILSSEMTEMI